MKLGIIGTAVGLFSLALVASAQAASASDAAANFYVGGGLALNATKSLSGNIDGSLGGQGLGSSTSGDKNSFNGALRLGYQFNPTFALEGSYDRVGKLNLSSIISTPAADTATGSWRARGLGLSVVGTAPVDKNWSIYGKVGIESWRTRLDLASNAGGATNVSNTTTNTALVLGAGASYAVTKNVDLTGDFTHFSTVGNSNTTGRTGLNQIGAGLRYHFS